MHRLTGWDKVSGQKSNFQFSDLILIWFVIIIIYKDTKPVTLCCDAFSCSVLGSTCSNRETTHRQHVLVTTCKGCMHNKVHHTTIINAKIKLLWLLIHSAHCHKFSPISAFELHAQTLVKWGCLPRGLVLWHCGWLIGSCRQEIPPSPETVELA